jgi:hypothetical protein
MSATLEVLPPTVSLHAPDARDRFLESMRELGFALITDCYTPGECELMKQAIIDVEKRESPDDPSFLKQAGQMWAIWNLYEHSPALMRLALAPNVMGLMWDYFQRDVHYCRGTLIKKTPKAEQSVGWHQDRPAPVDREQADEESVGVRAGVPHRNVSVECILSGYMIARVHVDDQFEDGGALLVAPGSFKHGVLPITNWNTVAEAGRRAIVPAPAGSVLFALPMTLHASGPNTRNDPSNHRRVLHNEFRTTPTPCPGFAWYDWPHGAVIKRSSVEFSAR